MKRRSVSAWFLSLMAVSLLCGCNGGGGGGGDNKPKPKPKVSVTVTADVAGLNVLVDGVQHAAPYTGNWTVGSSHTLGAPSPQTPGATTYIWSAWSDSGAQTHSITVPSVAATYTASFVVQGSSAISEYVVDAGGGEAVVDPYVTDHFAVYASVGQGTAHADSGSMATNGTTDCEAGFVAGSVVVPVNLPAPSVAKGGTPEQF